MKITGIFNFGFAPQKPAKMNFVLKLGNSNQKSDKYAALSVNHLVSFGKRIDLKNYKDEITKLHNEGKNSREIAEIIGCSHSAISFAVKRWGLGKKGDKDKAIKDEILRLYNDGKSTWEISDITGYPKMFVKKVLKEKNINLMLTPAKRHIDRIVELYEQGYTQKEIGEIIGCSQQTVSTNLKNIGYETGIKKGTRGLNELNKDLIIRLYYQGETFSSIAKKIGTTVGGVETSIKRWELAPRQNHNLNEYKDEIIKAYNMGATQCELAETLNCTQQAIHTALKRWGVLKNENI